MSQADYIKVTFETLAGGNMKVTGSEKLRELDPEVKWIFEKRDTPRWVNSWLYDGTGAGKEIQPEQIICQDDMVWIKTAFTMASERLAKIEEEVFSLRKNPVTETIMVTGHKNLEKKKLMRVLECKHPDGSVYNWYVEPDDRCYYHTGDFVEVEHLGGYKNDYVKVVGCLDMMSDDPEFPACRVVGKA